MSTKKIYENKILPLLPVATDSMIAKVLGCSREYVRQIRKKHNIQTPYKRTPICSISTNEEILSKIIALLDKETSRVAIADKLQIPIYIVRRVMTVNKLKLKNKIHKNTKYHKQMMIDLYIKHLGNFSEIAKELKAFQSTITKVYSKLGLHGLGLGNYCKRKKTQ